MSDGPRVTRVDELPRLPQSGGAIWRPIRRTLDLRGVSANAYTAATAGVEVIEDHDELSAGAAGHEELYIVTAGHATFTVDGEEVDAPAGTMLAIDPGIRRRGIARADETTVLVIGGRPGDAYPPAPFEYWYATEPDYAAGEYERGIEVLREGLEHHPTSPGLHYQLACYHALAGDPEPAIEHLRTALDSSEDGCVAGWLADDADLDSLRDRPDFPAP